MICRGVKYQEPEYWKFGEEGNKYFRHATGQIYVISKDLAAYISVNMYVCNFIMCRIIYIAKQYNEKLVTKVMVWFCRPILHKFANEDVSLGSWLIGLEVDHIDDRSLCCGTPPGISLHCINICSNEGIVINIMLK